MLRTLHLRAPEQVLDQLQRHRHADDVTDETLYSIRAGRLVQVAYRHGRNDWRCRVVDCDVNPQCGYVLTGADLATALQPDEMADNGHPDPAADIVAYRAAWRSTAWRLCNSSAAQLADVMAGDVDRDLTVTLDESRNAGYRRRLAMMPTGYALSFQRLTAAGLITNGAAVIPPTPARLTLA